MMRLGDSVKHVVFAHRKLSFGGGERVLIEQVAALAEAPVRVSVIFNKEPDRRDVEPELRRRNPNLQAVEHVSGAFAAWRWLRAQRPDLLVLCNHKGVQQALPFLGFRPPTLVTLHEHYQRHLARYRGIRKRVDAWIITWEFQEAVRALLGPQPCHVIHPLYPRRSAAPPSPEAKAAARAALGLPADALVLGYAGQIDRRKNPLATLALAEAMERSLGRPVHCLLAGREDRHAREDLDQALPRSPLRDRTVRTGALPEIGPAFDALDLYLMTSRNEGFFPIALLEAMERGVPVVAPTVGGIATRLRDGDGGFLMAKPDDRTLLTPAFLAQQAARIAPALLDPTAWAGLRAAALRRAQELNEGYDAAGLFRAALAPWL
jgi:glycosyltransferase involved in cell wall biosynthesis